MDLILDINSWLYPMELVCKFPRHFSAASCRKACIGWRLRLDTSPALALNLRVRACAPTQLNMDDLMDGLFVGDWGNVIGGAQWPFCHCISENTSFCLALLTFFIDPRSTAAPLVLWRVYAAEREPPAIAVCSCRTFSIYQSEAKRCFHQLIEGVRFSGWEQFLRDVSQAPVDYIFREKRFQATIVSSERGFFRSPSQQGYPGRLLRQVRGGWAHEHALRLNAQLSAAKAID
ncbi:hypothetical protein HUJ05_007006 [Dendroctonus ponderosae]|nr:hypothetical protein HUJ05_007006 [Dendroctonus ponderosae]